MMFTCGWAWKGDGYALVRVVELLCGGLLFFQCAISIKIKRSAFPHGYGEKLTACKQKIVPSAMRRRCSICDEIFMLYGVSINQVQEE